MDTSNSDPPLTTTTGLASQYRRSGDGLTAPTEPTAQYQQAGKDQLSHITDAAQLTLLISRADDVDMSSAPATPRPDTHDIATPRRRIGGRCRKCAVSTQIASQANKRKCASCTMYGQQFTPGEPPLQQRANRSTQRAYVHSQCITGGIGRDHELVPKAPQRTKRGTPSHAPETACLAQPPLRWCSPSTNKLTTTPRRPPDEGDRLFDREEALRHDDAIMDFQWFSLVPCAGASMEGATPQQLASLGSTS